MGQFRRTRGQGPSVLTLGAASGLVMPSSDGHEGRNVIEISFNDHKQRRGLATRYDKLAAVYRGGVVLRAITIWLTT